MDTSHYSLFKPKFIPKHKIFELTVDNSIIQYLLHLIIKIKTKETKLWIKLKSKFQFVHNSFQEWNIKNIKINEIKHQSPYMYITIKRN